MFTRIQLNKIYSLTVGSASGGCVAFLFEENKELAGLLFFSSSCVWDTVKPWIRKTSIFPMSILRDFLFLFLKTPSWLTRLIWWLVAWYDWKENEMKEDWLALTYSLLVVCVCLCWSSVISYSWVSESCQFAVAKAGSYLLQCFWCNQALLLTLHAR